MSLKGYSDYYNYHMIMIRKVYCDRSYEYYHIGIINMLLSI